MIFKIEVRLKKSHDLEVITRLIYSRDKIEEGTSRVKLNDSHGNKTSELSSPHKFLRGITCSGRTVELNDYSGIFPVEGLDDRCMYFNADFGPDGSEIFAREVMATLHRAGVESVSLTTESLGPRFVTCHAEKTSSYL